MQIIYEISTVLKSKASYENIVKEYLTQHHYSQKKSLGQKIIFERGSLLGSLIIPTARRMLTRISVHYEQNKLFVDVRGYSVGITTKLEDSFYHQLIYGLLHQLESKGAITRRKHLQHSFISENRLWMRSLLYLPLLLLIAGVVSSVVFVFELILLSVNVSTVVFGIMFYLSVMAGGIAAVVVSHLILKKKFAYYWD